MKPQEFLDLLQKDNTCKTISKTMACSAYYYLVSQKNLDDSVIKAEIIPKLIKFCSQNPYKHWDKDSLKNYLGELIEKEKISSLSAPIRTIQDNSQEQRRLDSVARLLSLSDEYTHCVALACIHETLFIAYNKSRQYEEKTLQKLILAKLNTISEFLYSLRPDNITHYSESIDVTLTAKASYNAINSVQVLLDSGGVGTIISSDPKKRKLKCQTHFEHLYSALLKVGHYYLLGVYTEGRQGFNQAFINAIDGLAIQFIDNAPNNIPLHAEQAVVYHYKHNVQGKNGLYESKPIHIGVSKLCCLVCANVLQRDDNFSFRGGHGIFFPNVATYNGENILLDKTVACGDTCPSDSDSDAEDYIVTHCEPI